MQTSDWTKPPELFSFLKTIVIRDIVETAGADSRKKEIYQRLQNLTYFTLDDVFLTASNISLLKIFSNLNDTVAVEKEASFGVVDHGDTFKLFQQNLGLFGKYKSAIQHNEMSFYTMRMIWLVRKNFCSDIFVNGLTILVESGIYQRWYKHNSIDSRQVQSYAAFKQMVKANNASIGTESNAGSHDIGTSDDSLCALSCHDIGLDDNFHK